MQSAIRKIYVTSGKHAGKEGVVLKKTAQRYSVLLDDGGACHLAFNSVYLGRTADQVTTHGDEVLRDNPKMECLMDELADYIAEGGDVELHEDMINTFADKLEAKSGPRRARRNATSANPKTRGGKSVPNATPRGGTPRGGTRGGRRGNAEVSEDDDEEEEEEETDY